MPDTFFDPHQRATVEAAMARIIPTDDTPGAREAGTIDFLDRYLSRHRLHLRQARRQRLRDAAKASRADAWQQRIEIMRGALRRRRARARRPGPRTHSARTSSSSTPEQQDEILPALEAAGRARADHAGRRATRSQVPASPSSPPCSRPAPRSSSTFCRCWSLTPARASTPTRSTAATATGSAGR